MIKSIAFDADDTLWVNETFFREAETDFCKLFESYLPFEECNKRLFEMEMRNLPQYGYGIKPFTLSLIECAIEITEGKVTSEEIYKIISIGKRMLNAPVELIDGIEEVLKTLAKNYKLVVATKGDLLDQERKLVKSGLSTYFHHIEVMSDKQVPNYLKLIKHLEVAPENFLMVGNSLKSDVLPVLEMGGNAFHIPFHTTWEHEKIDFEIKHDRFETFENAREILKKL